MKQRSATLTIITVICAFYLWELVDPGIIGTFALYKWDYFSQTHEYYRLLTVALVHDNSMTLPLHLAFNMMALHSVGVPVERIMGRARFLIIFFASLISGSLASSFLMGWNGYSIGASGAVFGMFGAFVVVGRKFGGDVRGMMTIIAINFAIGFTIGGVDWHAHLGGLIGGAFAAKALLRVKK